MKIDLNKPRMPDLDKRTPPQSLSHGKHWCGFQINLLHGLNDLCAKFVNPDTSVLEVGCLRGNSTEVFLQYTKNVTAVDRLFHKDLHRIINEYSNFKFVQSDSVKYMNQCFSEGVKYDLIYLDGDHTYKGVLADIEAAKKIIKKGGIISGHDMLEMREVDFGGYKNGVLKAVSESFPDILTGKSIIHRFSDSSWAIKL